MDPSGALSRKGPKFTRFACGPEDVLIASSSEDTALGSAEELDLPPLPSYKSNDRLFRRRRFAAGAVAGSVLLIAGCFATASYLWMGHKTAEEWASSDAVQLWDSCEHHKGASCRAPSLLLMPELHELAADNVLRLGHEVFGPDSASAVKAVVEACFRNVSAQLERHARQAAQELDTVRITPAQRAAIFNSLRLLGDVRVETIGLDLSEALQAQLEGQEHSFNALAEEAPRALSSLLQQVELGSLAEDLHMARLLWTEGRQWALSAEPEQLRSMTQVSPQWRAALKAMDTEKRKDSKGRRSPRVLAQEEVDAVTAGTLVQARALMGILRVRVRSGVPTWITSMSGYLGRADRDLSGACDQRAAHAAQFRIACPLLFGIQGMDALRAYYSEQRPPSIEDEQLLPQPLQPQQGQAQGQEHEEGLLRIPGG